MISDEAKIKSKGKSISSVWESVVKDIAQDDRRSSKSYSEQFNPFDAKVEFCTGSKYHGKYNGLGMAVAGKYRFPHGCIYEGGIEDGMFHGEGVLRYPMGQALKGVWEKGRMVSFQFQHQDGLFHDSNSNYCTIPDRRFTSCLKKGLQPAGKEFMANNPDRSVSPGFYDTGDGYYEPISRTLISARDAEEYTHVEEFEEMSLQLEQDKDPEFWNSVLTAMSLAEDERHNWIVKNCRKGWDESTGYRPDLYQDWVSGRRGELEKLEVKYSSAGDGDSVSSQPTAVAAKITKSVDYALSDEGDTI